MLKISCILHFRRRPVKGARTASSRVIGSTHDRPVSALVGTFADKKSLFLETRQQTFGLPRRNGIRFGNPHRCQRSVEPQQFQKITLAGGEFYTDIYTDIYTDGPALSALDLECLKNAREHEIDERL